MDNGDCNNSQVDLGLEPHAEKTITKSQRGPEYDVLEGKIWEVSNVLKDGIGLVSLMDCMPRMVPVGFRMSDKIADVARTSYGDGTKTVSDNETLVRYLYRNDHTTPFEFVQWDFLVVSPIFVRAQHFRHRTAKYLAANEESSRYSIVRDQQYIPPPSRIKVQSKTNKQGSAPTVASKACVDRYYSYLEKGKKLYEEYEVLVNEDDLTRELARIGLTQNTYTRYRFTMNLRNIVDFLQLRLDPHAQEEIQCYANAIYRLIEPLVGTVIRAFEDYSRQTIWFSRMECMALKANSCILFEGTTREQKEYQEKLKENGLWDLFSNVPKNITM